MMSDESFEREIAAKFFDGQDVKDLQDEYGLFWWQIEQWIRTVSNDPICANCGKSIFLHAELNYDGLEAIGGACDEFVKEKDNER
jgi:hypothetical protein